MDSTYINRIVNIRPNGAIIIENSILCDGEDYHGLDVDKHITCYTHIHEDHINGLPNALGRRNSHVYATNITKELSSALLRQDIEYIKERPNYHGLEINEISKIDNFEISFRRCNHILGSGQLLIRGKNNILYSSDFILEGTEIVKDVDYLILDTTHGKHSEGQTFMDDHNSKLATVKKVKEIIEGNTKQLNIYASRGTLQHVMSWIRKDIENITFFANKKEKNIAKVYEKYGCICGKIEDIEKFDQCDKDDQPWIRFLTYGSKPDSYTDNIPSIRIGASTTTNLDNSKGSLVVNLKEHATVDEVCEYVSKINPKHVVLDNSRRINSSENAAYLNQKLTKMDFSVSISPVVHPKIKL